MGLPNYLTFIRLFITPIFMLLYLKGDLFGVGPKMLPYALFAILAFSELSDFFDGFLARKLSQVTDLGKLLDPMTDSIYRISVFLTFTQPPVNLPLIIIFIFLARDSVISMLRTICALRGFALAARNSGKIKAILQGICSFIVVACMVPFSLDLISQELLSLIATISIGLTSLYALASGMEYMWANKHYIALLVKKNTKHTNIDLE